MSGFEGDRWPSVNKSIILRGVECFRAQNAAVQNLAFKMCD